MTRWGIGIVLAGVLVTSGISPARAQRTLLCNELGPSSPRRDEALRAVRMIMSAAEGRRGPRLPGPSSHPPYSWERMGDSPLIGMWKTDGGPMGQLARSIRWGSDEPLPGWRMHWVAETDAYAFTLTDIRDACGFSYSADERGTILRGIDVDARRSVVPVDTQ